MKGFMQGFHAGKTIAVFCLGMMISLAGSARAQSAPQASSADLQKVITQLNTAATKFYQRAG